jgi:hypothetical protein
MSLRYQLRRALATAALILAPVAPLSALTPALRAAPIEHDLQQGLAYLRTRDLAADISLVENTLAIRPALVLDLRQATADDETARALGKLLARPPATARFSRMLLVSRSTAPALLKQLATTFPGTVILAARTDGLSPDISVGTTPEEDALAYEALTSGVSLDKLLNGTTPQKVRYDEASLVRDHANGGNGNRSQPTDEPDAESDSPEETDSTTATDKTKPTVAKPPAQPVDRVLLRAVQLHRTLLALKKL